MYTAAIERLIHLGEVIDERGIAAVDVDLLLLGHDARDLGVQPVLVDVMIDDAAPGVVRERAFRLVASRVAALSLAFDSRAVSERELSSPVSAGR